MLRSTLHGQAGFSLLKFLTVLCFLFILAGVALQLFRPAPPPPARAPVQSQTPGPGAERPVASSASTQTATSQTWPPLDGVAPLVDLEAMLRRNYYVILDGSGSMREQGCSGDQSKFASARSALADFFATIPADANVGLYIFDEVGVSERVPLGTGNREQLKNRLQESVPKGGTPLSYALQAGYRALTSQAAEQLGYGEYHLVIVTDGEASKGYDPTRQVNEIIDTTSIVIHTIGYCIGEGHSLNQPGRTLYSTAQDASSLSRELQAVLAESQTFDISQFKQE